MPVQRDHPAIPPQYSKPSALVPVHSAACTLRRRWCGYNNQCSMPIRLQDDGRGMVLHRIYRIVCFTTKPDNLPMWSHYASHHQGVCLEYDPARLSGTALQNFLFPVVYTPKLPDGIEFLQSARQGSKPAGITGILPFLLHKLQDWAYEEEWRLLAHMELLCGTPGKLSETDWNTGHKLAFLRPSRVLLGFQIREDNEERIRQACELYGIPVVKMKLTEYGLREEQN